MGARRLLLCCIAVALLALSSAPGAAAQGAPATIVDGNARFEILRPTLIRLEYAADGQFEDRPSLNVVNRRLRWGGYRLRRTATHLTIRTRSLTLRYLRGSGPFGPSNLEVILGPRGPKVHPRFSGGPPPLAGPPNMEVSPYAVKEDPNPRPRTSGNVGGWYRALDLAANAVPLHEGLISREGFYLLDDSHTALLTDAPPGFAERPQRAGAYQYGYLFGYGQDYMRGLADLRLITGPAPLLPRKAFGVWFSRYFAYKQSDYAPLLSRFRAERMPLDVLMVDTDFKAPHAWNGWNWYSALFPDPKGFVDWAHSQDIAVSLNTHPSITADDPRFAEANRRAGGLKDDPTGVRCRTFTAVGDSYGRTEPGATLDCRVFDWTRPGDQDAFGWLHEPFERDGIDFWWHDYCCDESHAIARGLTQDTWANHLYARRSDPRGSRWPVLSRVGASVFEPDEKGLGIWGEHRNAIHFTGDARPTWSMLDFQTLFTAAEGNVGIPYVSHDIGGFGALTSDGTSGRHLPDDLYVRWVQSGAFQPILRLHSDHGDRLPWEYGPRAERIGKHFLRLRGELIPYVYTLARRAHDTGVPITRGTYLHWPRFDDAYRLDRQYMLGPHLLVAPVGTPGDPAEKEVWIPPGRWFDFFTGDAHRGPGVKKVQVPLDRMPVFARGGSIVPFQEYRQGNTAPPDRLVVDAYPGARGGFTLYEDEGDGLGYERRRFSQTRFSQRRRGRRTVVTIGSARGTYPGQPARRSYELRLVGWRRTSGVSVDGRPIRAWRHDPERNGVILETPPLTTGRAHRIVVTRPR